MSEDMNELLYETYMALRDFHYVDSAVQFSREYLGRSDRMYSWLLSSGHKPDIGVMVGLVARLEDLHYDATKENNTRVTAVLDDFHERITECIKQESLRKGPNRRKKHVGDDAQPHDVC